MSEINLVNRTIFLEFDHGHKWEILYSAWKFDPLRAHRSNRVKKSYEAGITLIITGKIM